VVPGPPAQALLASPSADRVEIIEDDRERFGYLLVKCPNDDGTNDHALHVCNPHGIYRSMSTT
jgi:hypothetical protein